MSKGLATLIKLQKTKLEEQQQVLSKLQAHLDGIEEKIQALYRQRTEEKEAVRAYPEMSQTYEAYLQRVKANLAELQENKKIVQQAVELARDQLALIFEEQKRYEIALANREAAELKEETRLETIHMDEIGGMAHERQRHH